MKKNNFWFTLIELVVSITILSIIMISVFTIFKLASDLNNKVDISRAMQENTKNIVETLAEDLRKNWSSWVNNDLIYSDCKLPTTSNYLSWNKLCIWDNSYYLAKLVWDNWSRIENFNDCINKQCFLVVNNWNSITQLSNSWVWFKNINFYISNTNSKKIIINFELEPSKTKWINSNLIKENKMIFQTTISERLYKDY